MYVSLLYYSQIEVFVSETFRPTLLKIKFQQRDAAHQLTNNALNRVSLYTCV
jgi:hypothetical protein